MDAVRQRVAVFSCRERGCDFVPTRDEALATIHREDFGHAVLVEWRSVWVPESVEVLAEGISRRLDDLGVERDANVRRLVGAVAESLAESLRGIG